MSNRSLLTHHLPSFSTPGMVSDGCHYCFLFIFLSVISFVCQYTCCFILSVCSFIATCLSSFRFLCSSYAPTLHSTFFLTLILSLVFFFKSLVTFTITLVSISLNIYPFRSSFYFLICLSLMAHLSIFQASLINYCLLLSFPVFTIALSFVQSLPHPFSRSVFLSFPYHPYSSFVHDQSLPSLLCFALPFLFHYRLSFLQTLAIPSF